MWSLARPLASDWMADQMNFSRRAEGLVEDVISLVARLPRLLETLETQQTPPPPPPQNGAALAIALLALGLAIFGIFI